MRAYIVKRKVNIVYTRVIEADSREAAESLAEDLGTVGARDEVDDRGWKARAARSIDEVLAVKDPEAKCIGCRYHSFTGCGCGSEWYAHREKNWFTNASYPNGIDISRRLPCRREPQKQPDTRTPDEVVRDEQVRSMNEAYWNNAVRPQTLSLRELPDGFCAAKYCQFERCIGNACTKYPMLTA